MHKEDGLRRALLAAARVGVLIAHVRDVIDVVNIWTEDFPVKSRILEFDVALELLGEMMRDFLRPGEQGHLWFGFL